VSPGQATSIRNRWQAVHRLRCDNRVSRAREVRQIPTSVIARRLEAELSLPDVAVFLKGTSAICKGAYCSRPDFAVEVISPMTFAEEVRFLREGRRQGIVLVDRKPWCLELYRLQDGFSSWSASPTSTIRTSSPARSCRSVSSLWQSSSTQNRDRPFRRRSALVCLRRALGGAGRAGGRASRGFFLVVDEPVELGLAYHFEVVLRLWPTSGVTARSWPLIRGRVDRPSGLLPR